MHLESLESTQEARVTLSGAAQRIFRALQTLRVHPYLDIRRLSINKFLIQHSDLFFLPCSWHVDHVISHVKTRPVIPTMDSAILRINHYPEDSTIHLLSN